MVFLCHKAKKGHKSISVSDASNIVTRELRQDWINKNVYPMTERNVSKKILDDYTQFKTLCKQEKNKQHNKSEDWINKVKQFNTDMNQHAYDIRAKNDAYPKNLEAEFGVKMTDEDTAFYKDSCMGSYTAICNATVSSSWMRNKKRKRSRTVSAERHSREMKESEREESVAKRLQYEEALDQYDTSVATDVDPNFNQTPTCTIFNNPTETYITTRSKSSRATVTSDEPIPQQDNSLFPRVKVRHSRKNIDENIMRCTVQCLADYKVSPGDHSYSKYYFWSKLGTR